MQQPVRDTIPPNTRLLGNVPTPTVPFAVPGFTKWAAGIAGLWVGLAVMAEFDSTRPLAVALAWAVTGGVILGNGPRVVAALNAAGLHTQLASRDYGTA